MRHLRRLRLWVAGIVFAGACAAFLLPENLAGGALLKIIGTIQFFPALVRQLAVPAAISLAFMALVLFTLLGGRVYCSTLCPLGIYQDMVIWLRRRLERRVRYRYRPPMYGWLYGILAFAGIAGLSGSLLALNVLEPFANFGRVMTDVVAPSLSAVSNAAAFLLSRMGIYAIVHVPLGNIEIFAVAGALLFLLMITVLSYREGRIFCNLLCPTGAVLSLLSRVSVFRLSIVESSCKGCGICERACKANCINNATKKIDWSACIGCYDCATVCPTDGVRFVSRFAARDIGEVAVQRERRQVLGVIAGSALLGGTMPARSERDTSRVPDYETNRRTAISPPGSVNRERFSDLCIACHACVNACPAKVITPALTEYGWTGIFQARMDYGANYCTFDCVACGSVCPTGAIQPITMPEKHLLQIGTATFVKADCVVETKKTDCGACSEHCPTKAVRMVPYGRLFIPEVRSEYCVGCGACEHSCPTKPRKAIYVVAKAQHGRALPPPREQPVRSFDSNQEFPF